MIGSPVYIGDPDRGPTAQLHRADCRSVLPTLPPGSIDCVLTDPPYASGGLHIGDRRKSPAEKYVSRGSETKARLPDFAGDGRDQRSYTLWCSDWMAQCLAAASEGAVLFCFIDWRNLPCIVDAVQVAGWTYRGIVPWNKGGATRPRMGWFRSQCEYIVCATAGGIANDGPAVCLPGFFTCHAPQHQKRSHITEKPIELAEWLLGVRKFRRVLDPFMGSGTTGVAALGMGAGFIGIECTADNFAIARKRIEAASKAPRRMLEPAADDELMNDLTNDHLEAEWIT
jgi:site-specific DNA-methyltransferase (adenine-specific)